MNENYVINIGRQLGSGGLAVGELLAGRLGIRFYDKELINLATRESGLCSEVFETADEKRSRGWLSGLIGYLRVPSDGLNDMLSDDVLFRIQSDVIRQVAARESALFVGRCADYILRDHPRALSVFITGDREDRIRRICEREGCSETEALRRMARGDAQRSGYYNYYSPDTWGAASTYDLCVNSSVLGVEGTAELIREIVVRRFGLREGR